MQHSKGDFLLSHEDVPFDAVSILTLGYKRLKPILEGEG
jgi:hypothetical protein